MFARPPSRSFWDSRVTGSSFASASRLLWLDPGRRSDLIAEQFKDTPNMIAESGSHRRGTRSSIMFRRAQLLMGPTEIVRASNQIHSGLQCLKTMSRVTTFSGERSQAFTHGSIETFNQGRIELLASRCLLEEFLRFLKSSSCHATGDFHHPLFLRMFDNGCNTQMWPDFQTASSSPSRPFHFFSKGTQDAFWVGIPAICADSRPCTN
jgi:hypothetical protein